MAKFKEGDWVEVVETSQLRTWGNWRKAIGFQFQITKKEMMG